MARAALLHLVRSRTSYLKSTNIQSVLVLILIIHETWKLFSLSHIFTVLRLAYSIVLGFHLGRGAPNAKIYTNFPKQFATVEKRWLSQSALAENDKKISIGPQKGGESGNGEKDTGIVYYGPISNTIKKVKLLSLSTCCLSVSLGPVITFMTSPDMNVILKGAMASSVIFLSASTTLALHWFVSPYVHKLRWQPGSDSFEVEMMTWLATYVPKTIKFADIRPPETNRPFVSFRANDQFYFVDADHCHNKALLAKLTPQKRAHESAFKNL